MNITNSADFESIIKTQVLDKLLVIIAKDIKAIMASVLRTNKIYNHNMETFAKYVTIKRKKSGYSIGVNFESMSYNEAFEPEIGEDLYDSGNYGNATSWGRFTNTWSGNGGEIGDVYWYGELITFRLAEWLNGDKSTSGNLFGNQPLDENNWFDKTAKAINMQMPNMIKKGLQSLGVSISKRR